MLQSLHLNLVSLGRNAALDVLDMLPEEVCGKPNFVRQLRQVYRLLLSLRFSGRLRTALLSELDNPLNLPVSRLGSE